MKKPPVLALLSILAAALAVWGGAPSSGGDRTAAAASRPPVAKAPKKAAKKDRTKGKTAARTTRKARTVERTTWGLRAVGAPALWQWGRGSPSVVVAVLDTGVDPAAGLALRPGWNVLTGSPDTRDDNGHGTQVAGVVAGRPTAGGAGGYCSACSIMPVKVLDGDGRGSGAGIATGIVWAAEHGARVVNLSFVLDAEDPAVAQAIELASDRGVAVVAATGNSGGTQPRFPAAEPQAISIAAAAPEGGLYPWSGAGSWVTAAAPGCNASTAPGGAKVDFCGTSSATAAASGLFALAFSDAPRAGLADLRAALAAGGRGAPIDGVALVRRLRAAR